MRGRGVEGQHHLKERVKKLRSQEPREILDEPEARLLSAEL
jgi:hypothetical protein